MKNTSIWRAVSEKSDFDSLTSEVVTDVVVIGGGITGLTAAYLLGKSGLKVVVLEAIHVGGGTTGFSTGNLYCTVDEYLQKIQSKYGTDHLKQLLESRSTAINLIRENIQEFNLDCELINTPFYFFAESEDAIETIKKEADAATEAGLKVSLEKQASLPFKIELAMKLSGQAQFNPMKYIKQLSKSIQGKFCTIYEESKAVSYTEKDGIYTVNTGKGAVKARHIILATHTPKGILGIQTLLFPYREYALAYKYDGSLGQGIYWGIDQDKKHSVRHYQSGDQKFLLVLGEKHKTGQKQHNQENIESLKSYANSRFDLGMEPDYVWGAQHYRSSDGLPFIGKVNSDSEVYLASGYSTDGLVYGTLAGIILSDLINMKKNAFEDLYSPQRHHPLQSAPGFIKENINVLAQYLKDLPFIGDVKNTHEIQAGEAKIMEQDGEKLAIYKDKTNKLHICSAVCTHMECIVAWNEVESSWDCPCHGSRFTYEGKVIEGPAINDLAKVKAKS